MNFRDFVSTCSHPETRLGIDLADRTTRQYAKADPAWISESWALALVFGAAVVARLSRKAEGRAPFFGMAAEVPKRGAQAFR